MEEGRAHEESGVALAPALPLALALAAPALAAPAALAPAALAPAALASAPIGEGTGERR